MPTKKAPGKGYRDGITLAGLFDMFPNEASAHQWFVRERWGKDVICPRCGSCDTKTSKRAFTFWCRGCEQRFSVRTGTVMEESRLPLRKWAIAIYLHVTSLKGVSSMKLHRDIGVCQKTAWFMLQRIRKAWKRDDDEPPMDGPVEVDETYMGGKERNKHSGKRHRAWSPSEGKTVVVGAKDRATNKVSAAIAEKTDRETLQGFVGAIR